MQTKEPDEERILVSWVDGIAFIHRIARREICVGRSGRGHPLARRNRDALHADFAVLGGNVYSSGLRPRAVERFRRTPDIMTAFRLGDRQGREVGGASDPVGQVAAGQALDLDLSAAIQVDDPTAEVGEDREIEVALQVSACDEASKQTGKSDLDFSRLSERLFEDERRSWSRSASAAHPGWTTHHKRCPASATPHEYQHPRSPRPRGRRSGRRQGLPRVDRSYEGASWSQREGSPKIVVLKGADHAVDISRPGADRLRDVAPCGGDRRDLFYDGAGLRQRQPEVL
jgi:hypothetical protein